MKTFPKKQCSRLLIFFIKSILCYGCLNYLNSFHVFHCIDFQKQPKLMINNSTSIFHPPVIV